MNTLEYSYNQFIENSIKTQKVYTLGNENNVALCPSNQYDTSDGKEAVVLVFWSDKEKAKKCQELEWEDYNIIEIPLGEFLEAWCLGMIEDGMILGTDFTKNLIGYEVPPFIIAKTIVQQIIKTKTKIQLSHFQSISDLNKYLNQIELELEF